MSGPHQKIELPRLGGFLRTTGWVIRCRCWRCRWRVPLLRRRHQDKLIREAEARL